MNQDKLMVFTRVVVVVAVLYAILCSVAKADSFSLKDTDKQLHVVTSYAGTLTLGAIYERIGVKKAMAPIASAVSMFFVGLAKESLDSEYSSGDVKANAIGCIAGGLFVWKL